MAVTIFVLNTGSSSLKFALFDENLNKLLSGTIPVHSETEVPEVIHKCLQNPQNSKLFSGVAAIGHRVVQGGLKFRESVRLDREAKNEIARLTDLAPLHNGPALKAIDTIEKIFPHTPQVAVFDTAFYVNLPPKAYIYPLPYQWHTKWAIRRFGFHGISHAYCLSRAAEILGRNKKELRIVSCHLGNGCSATAIQKGVAVATTMGFSPLEGLMMGTRSGSIDPGILLYVQQHKKISLSELENVLNNNSGLLGVSGVSSDFRDVEKAANQGHERASLALEIYSDRIRSAIGGLAVTMGGMDVLVFTGGVGEHSSRLRAKVCQGLECLGVQLDSNLNASTQTNQDISSSESSVRILLIHTCEEQVIARETLRLLVQ